MPHMVAGLGPRRVRAVKFRGQIRHAQEKLAQ
jgi:hypothetical protein